MPAGRACTGLCTGGTCGQLRCCFRQAPSSQSRTTRCSSQTLFLSSAGEGLHEGRQTWGLDWQRAVSQAFARATSVLSTAETISLKTYTRRVEPSTIRHA